MEINPIVNVKYQRAKTLKVSTTDDKSLELMHDIQPREKGKKRKAPISDSKNVNNAKINDSLELEKVFKSSRRGI